MRESDWVVVLGGGVGQLPLIKAVQEIGLKALVIGSPGDYPGYKLADAVGIFDFNDKNKLLRESENYNVKGVVTQVDSAVPIAAWLSKQLSLPTIGDEVAELFTNKSKMRVHCEKHGISSPKWQLLKGLNENEFINNGIPFPLVVKPVDGSASKGVSIVKNEADLEVAVEDAFKNSRSSSVIVEEYVHGKEYVIEAVVSEGKGKVIAVGVREYFNLEGKRVPSQTIFYDTSGDKILEEVVKCYEYYLETSNMKWGLSHAEFIVNRDLGKFYFIEAAARGGGAAIASDLIPLHTGLNVNRMLVEMSIGEKPELPSKIEVRNAVAYVCFYLQPGKLKNDFSIDDIGKIEGVEKVYDKTIPAGSMVEKIKDKGDRLGPIILVADKVSSIKQKVNFVKKILKNKPEYIDDIKRDLVWE